MDKVRRIAGGLSVSARAVLQQGPDGIRARITQLLEDLQGLTSVPGCGRDISGLVEKVAEAGEQASGRALVTECLARIECFPVAPQGLLVLAGIEVRIAEAGLGEVQPSLVSSQ